MKKKMKDKAFARSVNRQDIVEGAHELGVAGRAHRLLRQGDAGARRGAGARGHGGGGVLSLCGKLLLFLILIAAPACRRSEKPIVGVVPKGANHIFWQTVHAGAIKAGREYGFDIQWNAAAWRSIPAGRSRSSIP